MDTGVSSAGASRAILHELPRVLNASHATSFVVGIIIGSGIFLVPREMMAAVGIELLLTTMIRRKNLAGIDLKKSFWPVRPTPAGAWSLSVDPCDVKNRQPLRFALSKPTIRLIDFYLNECRPLLLKEPTDLMFLRTNGEPKGRAMMANLVCRTLSRRLDLDVNIHLFRHIGTMLYLDAHPGHFGVPQVMLGHTSNKTTQQFYAHLQTTQAIIEALAATRWSDVLR